MSWITPRIFCVILCFLQFATVKVGLCGLFGTASEIHCRSNIRTTEISRPETIYTSWFPLLDDLVDGNEAGA